jgi:hypothetical protein
MSKGVKTTDWKKIAEPFPWRNSIYTAMPPSPFFLAAGGNVPITGANTYPLRIIYSNITIVAIRSVC